MCAPRKAKLLTNDNTRRHVLEVLKGLEVDVLEDDAIFDLRPEKPSCRAIAWWPDESLSLSDTLTTG